MAVAIRSSSTLSNALRTNSTVTAPASIVNDDVLCCLLIVGNTTSPAVTPPTGWTEWTTTPWPITYSKADPWEVKVRLFTKVASGESGNYTFTHASAYTEAVMYALSGADTATPLSPNPTGQTGTGLTSTALSITPTVNDSFIVFAAGAWDAAGPSTPPTGTTPTFTERYDPGSGGIFYVADGVLATAAATGNKSYTNANTNSEQPWGAGLICVQAATAGDTLFAQGVC